MVVFLTAAAEGRAPDILVRVHVWRNSPNPAECPQLELLVEKSQDGVSWVGVGHPLLS